MWLCGKLGAKTKLWLSNDFKDDNKTIVRGEHKNMHVHMQDY